MLGHGLVDEIGCGLLKLHGVLTDAKILCVPLLGKFITVIDKAVTAVHDERSSALEIGGSVVLLFTERHAGAVSKNR